MRTTCHGFALSYNTSLLRCLMAAPARRAAAVRGSARSHHRPAAPAHDPHEAPSFVIVDLTHPGMRSVTAPVSEDQHQRRKRRPGKAQPGKCDLLRHQLSSSDGRTRGRLRCQSREVTHPVGLYRRALALRPGMLAAECFVHSTPPVRGAAGKLPGAAARRALAYDGPEGSELRQGRTRRLCARCGIAPWPRRVRRYKTR
jgi:hypothetical protein